MVDAKKTYNRNGFVILKGVLEREAIFAVTKSINKLFASKLYVLDGDKKAFDRPLFENMKALLSIDVEAYLAVARTVPKMHETQKLMIDARIAEAVKTLGLRSLSLPSEPVFHISSEKLRIPNGYYGFETHQDWPSIQGSLDGVVAWLPLVDVSKSNFPMLVIPGSHLGGLRPGKANANLYQIEKQTYSDTDFVPTVAEVGDLVLMSVWTLHRTAIEGCQGFRLSLSNRWENLEEATFIDRNFPCAYKKSVEREFFVKNFPPLELVKRQFE